MGSASGNIELLELVFSTLKFNQQVLFNLTVESFAAKEAFNAVGPEAAKTYNQAKLKYQHELAGKTSEMVNQLDKVLVLLAKSKAGL